MRRLIVAGLVYLTGIAVILVIKPQYMFREDGRWKEFGIGRDPANFTHVPFWMFAIIWAIVSYASVSIIEDGIYGQSSTQCEPCQATQSVPTYNNSRNNRNSRNSKASNQQELTPGYYMLNEGATGRNGVPRYVYLGPEEPDL
uniref:Uncharacterized protein n=1 Tax=viral metagenome TaxID=1070528 RepID=A0A6C0AP01_9ZZZZ